MRSLPCAGRRLLTAAALVGLVLAARLAMAQNSVPDAVKPYEKVSGISGTLNSVGSDTLNNLMTYWAEAFAKIYPNVKIQVEGKGSATAPARPDARHGEAWAHVAEDEDRRGRRFRGQARFRPMHIDVAVDCLAVYVHKDNPIRGFTMAQLDCIFSKTRKSGFADIATWGDLGLTGAWANLPISLYGRNSASGTYAYFKEHALLKGDYKDTVKEQPGSAAVVNGVANDRGAIGYSGIGYRTSEVRAVALAKTGKDKLVEPAFQNALNGSYPLGRMLYIYVAKKPGEPLSPVVREFLKFVLSREGQEIVIKDGYGPLPATVQAKQFKVIE